jgi:alkylation response protein AidB-like acyl-CoA dehydrogenase
VFLSDVVVPDRHRLGEVGQGWGVSMHMLGAEREGVAENESPLPWLLQVWQRHRGDAPAVLRDRVARSYVDNEVSRLLALRATSTRTLGDALAPLVKLSRNVTEQETGNLVADVLGPHGTIGGDYDWPDAGTEPTDQLRFLWTRETTIGGGTVQILRNLVGERLLGLPPEIRLDKDLPWQQVRRS